MGFRDESVAPVARRRDGTRAIDRSRAVPNRDGDFSLPDDLTSDPWDLDPNADGDLTIPDDIDGRDADDLPDVGGSSFISFNLRSVGDGTLSTPTNQQNITLALEWYDDEEGSNQVAFDDKNDDAIFGPAQLIRVDVFVPSDFVKIIISSDAGAGTTNRLTGTINAH